MPISNFTSVSVPDMTGKTVLITGGESGIGLQAARALSACGANIIIGYFDKAAFDATAEIAPNPSGELAGLYLDLSNPGTIRTFVDQVLDPLESPGVPDVLINNAGVLMSQEVRTDAGHEYTMAVNHLGPFMLTNLLLPHMMRVDSSRIITTSSMAHRAGARSFDTMMSPYTPFKGPTAYSNSKLANLWMAFELDRRLKAIGSTTASLACHPGAAMTGITRNLPNWDKKVFGAFSSSYNSTEAAAWPTLAAATAPGVEGGEYIGPGGYAHIRGPAKSLTPSRRARSEELAARCWERSAELIGIHPAI